MSAPRVRTGITVPTIPAPPPIAKSAIAAAKEWCAKGYEEIWLAEVNTGDAYALAGALSQAVPGVRIGVGVTPLLTRTPFIHAMAGATLHELTDGNFALGLGISSENIVRDWGGQPYDKPLTRMREYLQVVRGALAGEKVNFEGKTLNASKLRLANKLEGKVPIYLGALNPGMLRLAGALADGVVLNMVPESALPQVLGEVRKGAEEAGRDPGELEVIARLHVFVSDNLEQGRGLVKMSFGPYAATAGYNKFFRWAGMEDEAEGVLTAFQKGDRQGVAAAMTDRLCDAIGVVGPEEHVKARIRAYAEGGVDVCVVNPVSPSPDLQRRVLESLANVTDGIQVTERGVMRATKGS